MTIKNLERIREFVKEKEVTTRYKIMESLQINYETINKALYYLQHVEKTVHRIKKGEKEYVHWG